MAIGLGFIRITTMMPNQYGHSIGYIGLCLLEFSAVLFGMVMVALSGMGLVNRWQILRKAPRKTTTKPKTVNVASIPPTPG